MTDDGDLRALAWSDQFGALVRDKVREMQAGIVATGWDTIAHVFVDPYDDDRWRLHYEVGAQGGQYYLTNTTAGDGAVVLLDIDALGVNR